MNVSSNSDDQYNFDVDDEECLVGAFNEIQLDGIVPDEKHNATKDLFESSGAVVKKQCLNFGMVHLNFS